jgi:predicted phage terminase large subunit-like protein
MEEVLEYRDLAPVHAEIEASLKKAEECGRGLFLLPRGHLKSTEITIAYTIQRILKNPNVRVLITNALLDNSKGFLREIKSHFEKNERLKALYGEYQNSDEKWSESQIIVKKRTTFSKEPTVQITSVDKSVVSQHYDLIVADDLVTRDSISTKEQRAKLVKYYKDLLDLLEPGGTLLVIGTRWHYDDLYGWLLRQDGPRETLIRRVLNEKGKPIFPQKFSDEHIARLKSEKGAYEFNAQYNNDPVSEADADFKRETFRYIQKTPDDGVIYITIDPAATTNDQSDFTGIVVNCVTGGTWNIIEAYQLKLNPTEIVDEIFHLQAKYRQRLRCIAIEDMMFTKALDYDITRRMRETNQWFTVEKVKHKGRNKESRIRGLIPLFERGNINLSDRCSDLEDELMRFPAGEHDDILDALAYQLDVVKATENYSGAVTFSNPNNAIITPIFPKY